MSESKSASKIVKYPDPRLLQECTAVGDDLEGIPALVKEMGEAMFAGNGAGLAAPQIGVSTRVFIIEAAVSGREEADDPMVFIDPEIVEVSKEEETAEEGCLSFPGIYVPVKRHLRVKMRARDIEGKPFEVEGDALFARAMQHELDHLNGRLLIHYVGRLKKRMIVKKLERESEAEV
jgi:peptide deformylase